MKNGSKVAVILKAAIDCARRVATFFEPQGQGDGNRITNAFMRDLRTRLAHDRCIEAEKSIFEGSNSKVDFYILGEETVVEVALSLRNPSSEFYKDLFKALIMKNSYKVKKLVFISKRGGKRKIFPDTSNTLEKKTVEWVKEKHGIAIEVEDI